MKKLSISGRDSLRRLFAVVIPALFSFANIATAAPASIHTLGQAPAGLVSAIANTQAKDAAKDPAYQIAENGCVSIKTGAKTNFTSCFTSAGPVIAQGRTRIDMHLVAWGRANHLHAVQLKRSAPRANRIAYQGKHISEWWRVLPMGYEQGFTLNQAPNGYGKLVLKMTASATPQLNHGTLSWGTLRYGKLHVTDAAGRVLPATLGSRGITITLAIDAQHARFPITVDPILWTKTATLTGSDADFGDTVAFSANGTTALAGDWAATVNGKSSQGAAYIYTYNATTGGWTQAAELTASDGVANDNFGYGNLNYKNIALSADGSTALVSAMMKTVNGNGTEGEVYLYRKPSGGWTTSTETAKLFVSSAGAAGAEFGSSLALSANGSTVLVGADLLNGPGAVFVYTEPSPGWVTTSTPTVALIPSDITTGETFGNSVALSTDGSTALIGAESGGNLIHGVAYIYVKPSGGWATSNGFQTSELSASDGAQNDFFGNAVALSADGATALVGAYNKTVNNNGGQGAAYVYAEPTGGWAAISNLYETAELTASNGSGDDYFGQSVALSADGAIALIGEDGRGGVAADMYSEPASGGWITTSAYTAELIPTSPQASFGFGGSVSLSADGATALIGGDSNNNSLGVVYVMGSGTGSGSTTSNTSPSSGSASSSSSGGGALNPWALLLLLACLGRVNTNTDIVRP